MWLIDNRTLTSTYGLRHHARTHACTYVNYMYKHINSIRRLPHSLLTYWTIVYIVSFCLFLHEGNDNNEIN